MCSGEDGTQLDDEDQAKFGTGKRNAKEGRASVGTFGALSEAARLGFLMGEGTVVIVKEATSWVITSKGRCEKHLILFRQSSQKFD